MSEIDQRNDSAGVSNSFSSPINIVSPDAMDDKSGNMTKFDLTNDDSTLKQKYTDKPKDHSEFSESPEFQPIRDRRETEQSRDNKIDTEIELRRLKNKLYEYASAEEELIEFNKELQWTLMMMKKDNDALRDSLSYVIQGGDPKKIQEAELAKLMGESPDGFKTPKVDNIFEMHSEFQSASPQVKQFDEGVDESVKLRASQVPTEENPEE